MEEKDTRKALKPVERKNLSPEREDEKNASKSVDLEHDRDKKVKPDGRKESEEKDSNGALKSASQKKLSPERGDEKLASKPVSLKKSSPEREDDEKASRPISLKKRMSFSSSIECIKRAVEDEEEERRPLTTNLRSISFASSMENIAVGDESQHEKVHLSCFSKEMGSNVDLVQICQDQEPGKHEVKLEFEIEGTKPEKERSEREKKDEEREEQERKERERIKLEKKDRKERRDSERREKEKLEEERLEEDRKETERKEKERKRKE